MRNSGSTIVIKLGTSSICDEKTHEPLLSNLALIVETCVKLTRQGHRVVLVSSGAIGVGLKRLNLAKRPKGIANVQAIAAVGQCRLMALWDKLFEQLGQPIAQILLTRNDIADRNRYNNAKATLNALLDDHIIPVVNENDTVAVSEIKFGDNDTLSAITAAMLAADYLFLMTDVECLYTNNPRTDPDAKPIEVVEDISQLKVDVSSAGSGLGTGGMATKITAARLATAAGVTTIIAHSSKPSNIFLIVSYIERLRTYYNTPVNEEEQPGPRTPEDPVATTGQMKSVLDLKSRPSTRPPSPIPFKKDCPRHTRFLPKPRTIKDRKFWILYGLAPHGTVFIDEGAYRAMTRTSRAGLLPVGVVGVTGNFAQQEPVRLVVVKRPSKGESVSTPDLEEEGDEVGRAIVNYSSVEIAMIKGCQSKEIYDILGYADSEYISYRDNQAFHDHPITHNILPDEPIQVITAPADYVDGASTIVVDNTTHVAEPEATPS